MIVMSNQDIEDDWSKRQMVMIVIIKIIIIIIVIIIFIIIFIIKKFLKLDISIMYSSNRVQ